VRNLLLRGRSLSRARPSGATLLTDVRLQAGGETMGQDPTEFEQSFAELNANFFLREFTYARNHFTPEGGSELELADHVIALRDLRMVFQMKERDPEKATSDPNEEKKWFDQKVQKEAIKQIKNTLEYLRKYNPLVPNQRGLARRVGDSLETLRVVKLVVHNAADALPDECRHRKSYISKTAGFVHVVAANDWLGILTFLVTPREIWEYFEFRERVCLAHPETTAQLKEQALVGQFLAVEGIGDPSPTYEERLSAFLGDPSEFDMSGVLRDYAERMVPLTHEVRALVEPTEDREDSYYRVLEEFANMPRTALKLFKERMILALQRCGQPRHFISRFVSDGVGFVILGAPEGAEAYAARGLKNYLDLHMYDQRVDIGVGLAIAKDGEFRNLFWQAVKQEWLADPDLENSVAEAIRDGDLPALKGGQVPRYHFRP
jgi:hypothetical protein